MRYGGDQGDSCARRSSLCRARSPRSKSRRATRFTSVFSIDSPAAITHRGSAAIRAVVIAPVAREGRVVIPPGSILSGSVTGAGKESFGGKRHWIALELDSIAIPIDDAASDTIRAAISVRIASVDDAREDVDSAGRIVGPPIPSMVRSKRDWAVLILGVFHPVGAIILAATLEGEMAERHRAVSLDRGTELTAVITRGAAPERMVAVEAAAAHRRWSESRLARACGASPYAAARGWRTIRRRHARPDRLRRAGERRVRRGRLDARRAAHARSDFVTFVKAARGKGYAAQPVSQLVLDGRPNGIGGRIFTTLWCGPSVPSRMPRSRMRFATNDASAPAGSSVSRSRTSSTPQKQSRAAHVANDRESIGERAEPRPHALAHRERVRLQLLVAHDVEHRDPDRARHGVPAERAEELHPVVERVGDRARRRHGADRVPVAERLAHDDDVGHDALILERPEARAHPPEPRLHFVGDAHAAGVSHVCVDVGEIPRGQYELPANARARLGDERSDATPRVLNRPQRVAHRRRVSRSGIRIARLVRAAIDVGKRRDVHPVRRAAAAGPVVLVRADVDERRRVAVIRRLEHDHVAIARVRARQPERQLVRLARRVHEVADVERGGSVASRRSAYSTSRSLR